MKLFIVASAILAVCAAEAPLSGGYRSQMRGKPIGGYQVSSASGGYSESPSVSASGGYSGSSSVSGGYQAPSAPSGGYQSPSSVSGGYAGNQGSSADSGASAGGQVRRYVSIHVAPEEPQDDQDRVIRVPSNKDKHVNIIFVKAPSQSGQAMTEVILPEPAEQKTIVYVLVRKPSGGASDVKIKAPAPTKPSKPEVFFIKYSNKGASGASSAESGAVGDSYGVPPQTPPGPY